MTNKEIVLKMYDVVFNGHNLDRAKEFIKDNYIQHNPGVPTGLEGFLTAFKEHFKKFPDFKVEVKRVIAEGDFVMLHTHAIARPGQDEGVVVDIYRLEDGMIAEHWDVLQPMPKKFVHENGMF